MNFTVMSRSAAALLAIQLVAGAANAQSAPPASPQADTGDSGAETSSSAKPIVVYALAGLGAVSLGTGAYFWFDSYSKGQDVSDLRDSRPSGFCKPGESVEQCGAAQNDLLSMQDDQDSAAGKAQIFYVAGSLLVVSAVLTDYFWDDAPSKKESSKRSDRVSIAPLQGGALLGVSHAF